MSDHDQTHEQEDRLRVLIADDTPTVRRLLRHFLEPEHLVVGEAANGHEAIQLTEQLSPDVVLMDLVMPCVGGLEATRQLQEHHPEVMVIVASCKSEWEALRQAMIAGASDFVPKPFDRGELQASLDRARMRLRSQAEQRGGPSKVGAGTWSFVSSGTGDGRTTLMLSMAHVLAQAGRRVLLVDLDPIFGEVSFKLGIEEGGPGMADLLEADEWLDPEVLARHVRRHPSGVEVLAPPSSPAQAEAMDWGAVAALFGALERSYDHILADLPPGLPEQHLPTLDRSRFIFPVSGVTPGRLRNFVRLNQLLSTIGYSASKVRPLVTLQGRGGEELAWLERARLVVAGVFPADPKAGLEALERGVPITGLHPTPRLATRVRSFVERLVQGPTVKQTEARAAA